MKYLFVAEKPSLMRDVKQCYENHKNTLISKVGSIDFIALAGHACGWYMPDDYEEWSEKKWDDINYPIIPETWGIKPIERMKKTLSKLKSVINDYDGVIVGTDSDQEGYGIYYLVEHYLHIENKKALRFVEHSLTDKEILEQLQKMTDYHTDPVHVRYAQSFLLRSKADWLFGMNVSREMTIKAGSVQNVGRVKSPTIKLIYDNSLAIDNFKPEQYFQLQAAYKEGFVATLVDKNGKPIKFKTQEEIPSVPNNGTVLKIKKELKETHAPKLYDLSALQGDAGIFYHMKPSETLEIAQSLYEKHKILTYPRTQCRYVSKERAKAFPEMLEKVRVFPELKPYADLIADQDIAKISLDKSVVNDKEVQKESHDALLPTSNLPDIKKLSAKEYQICLLVYKRFLAQFLPKLQEEKVLLITSHGQEKYLFSTTGKSIKDLGWRELYGKLRENLLPPLEEGQQVEVKKFANVKKSTTPPKRLNEASLVTAMDNIANLIEDAELRKTLSESNGIGTVATRAAIISDIVNSGYADSKEKGLFITEKGKKYIESMKDLDIIYPSFAAVMDMKIKQVQRGEAEFESVYRDVLNDLENTCRQVEKLPVQHEDIHLSCPVCGAAMHQNNFYYSCSSCDFQVNRYVCDKMIPPELMQNLFNGGKTAKCHFRTKSGKDIYAGLIFSDGKLAFDFSSGITCPFCGKELTSNRGGYFCDCGLKLFNPVGGKNGKKLTESQVRKLLKEKELPEMDGFPRKSGGTFSAGLKLNDDKTVSFVFSD